jgi:hypothetical protein
MLACVPLALVSILYWLSLSTWFGAAVFVAVAAPSIIRTVRENDPLLPTVLSVNLEGQHGTLLAGSIVNTGCCRWCAPRCSWRRWGWWFTTGG